MTESDHNSDHIIYWPSFTDRAKGMRVNRLLLNLHRFLALTICFYFIYQGVSDSDIILDYQARGVLYFIVLMYIGILGGYIIASIILYIPACAIAKRISPEIILTNDYLIYLGGSQSLNYSAYIDVLPFFRYLIGLEDSHSLPLKDIEYIGTEKPSILMLTSRHWISIKHRNGKILTGIALSPPEKDDIINTLNKRMSKK
jgi:hypothetical protein